MSSRLVYAARIAVRTGSLLAIAGAAHSTVNVRLWRRPIPGSRGTARASVLIPARDEAATIAACLHSVRGQGAAEVLVLDDGSSDATAAIARDAGARVLDGTAPAPGWLGKTHACAQLAAAADPANEVLVFLDADVQLEPVALTRAVALLERTGLDLISPHPRQVAVGAAERLVQPLLQWSILTFLPLRLAERSARPSLSAANGQFLLIRRTAYDRAGGHSTIRGAVLDDVALLRAVKAAGGSAALVDGTQLAACRMYDGWTSVRDGYTKSLWAAFGSPAGSVAVMALLGAAYVVPPVAALLGSRTGLVGYGAAVAGRAVTAQATGGRPWPDSLAHPASIAVLGYLVAHSHLAHRRGTLRWRGRPL